VTLDVIDERARDGDPFADIRRVLGALVKPGI
jgi:hypothetical protein